MAGAGGAGRGGRRLAVPGQGCQRARCWLVAVAVRGRPCSSWTRLLTCPLPSRCCSLSWWSMTLLCRSSLRFVQFLDKVVDMPVVVQFFDKVADVPVVQVVGCRAENCGDSAVAVLDKVLTCPLVASGARSWCASATDHGVYCGGDFLVLCFWELIVVCQRHRS